MGVRQNFEEALNRSVSARVADVARQQNGDGSFPWGNMFSRRQESVDMTAWFLYNMHAEPGIDAAVDRAARYIDSRHGKGDLFVNEWTGQKNPKTAALVGLAMERAVGPESDVVFSSSAYVKESVDDIIRRRFGERALQNNFMSALQSAEYLHSIDGGDPDVARLFDFIEGFREPDGGFYYRSENQNLMYSTAMGMMKGSYKAELTSYVSSTLSNEMGLNYRDERVGRSVDFIERTESRSLSAILAMLSSEKYRTVANLPDAARMYLEAVVGERPTGHPQNRMHDAGKLIAIRDRLVKNLYTAG